MPALEQARMWADALPRHELETLLLSVLERERSFLYAHPEYEWTPEEAARFRGLLDRRLAGEPLQYLTGEQEFHGRRFLVTPAVLIPRPETELVAAAVLEKLPQRGRVLDVGTGSGCLALTVALERPDVRVAGSDISGDALAVAAANARRLDARVDLVRADLLLGFGGTFDLIAANPPYIAAAEYEALAPEVRDHEPRQALLAGATGLEVYTRLIAQAAARLRRGGWLVLELGYTSAPGVRALLGPEWDEIETRPDGQGWERVLLARRRWNRGMG